MVASPSMEITMTKDAISYIRVSSEEQADSGLGLEAQRQRIAAYCTMKGLHLAEVFEDPGNSAGKPLASRPVVSRLLAASKKARRLASWQTWIACSARWPTPQTSLTTSTREASSRSLLRN